MATVLEPSIDRGPAPESSDRSFGFVFAAVFALIGCWPLIHLAAAALVGARRSPSRSRSSPSFGRSSCIRSTAPGSRSAGCCTGW